MAVAATLLTGCGSGGRPAPPWQEIPYDALTGGATATPLVASVLAGSGSAPWLLGGVEVDAAGERHVRIWSSTEPTGPWRVAAMDAVAGRTGPEETVDYLTTGPAGTIALGASLSPDEGYPRPSTWLAGDPAASRWQEVLEDREFFGGPDIISFGGMSEGPLGCIVAGTWTDARGRPVISVWTSRDGLRWSHDYTEPAFEGAPGEVPFASGVAAGAAGELVSGSVEIPTAADPGRQEGALWLSSDGTHWRRLVLPSTGAASGPGTTFDAVAAFPSGWLVAGTLTRGGGEVVPAVWEVDGTGRVGPPVLLPVAGSTGTGSGTAGSGAAGSAIPTAVEVDGLDVTVAARWGGSALLWSARLGRRGLSSWRSVPAPVATVPQLQDVRLASGPAGRVLVMTGANASLVFSQSGT